MFSSLISPSRSFHFLNTTTNITLKDFFCNVIPLRLKFQPEASCSMLSYTEDIFLFTT